MTDTSPPESNLAKGLSILLHDVTAISPTHSTCHGRRVPRCTPDTPQFPASASAHMQDKRLAEVPCRPHHEQILHKGRQMPLIPERTFVYPILHTFGRVPPGRQLLYTKAPTLRFNRATRTIISSQENSSIPRSTKPRPSIESARTSGSSLGRAVNQADRWGASR